MNNFFKITLITILASISSNAMQEPIKSAHLRTRFTDEEDKKLTEIISQNPAKRWAQMAEFFPGRTARQLAARWNFHLDPHLKKNIWTTDEDERLQTLHKTLGDQWPLLSQYLEGRSSNAIRLRWRLLSKKIVSPNPDMPLTIDEDENIQTPHQIAGNQWSATYMNEEMTDSRIQPTLEEKQAPEPTDLQPVPQPEVPNWNAFEFYDYQNTADLFSDFDPENADF